MEPSGIKVTRNDKGAIDAGRALRDGQMADRWLDGVHLYEVARGHGLEVKAAQAIILSVLVDRGEVARADALASGIWRVKGQERPEGEPKRQRMEVPVWAQ